MTLSLIGGSVMEVKVEQYHSRRCTWGVQGHSRSAKEPSTICQMPCTNNYHLRYFKPLCSLAIFCPTSEFPSSNFMKSHYNRFPLYIDPLHATSPLDQEGIQLIPVNRDTLGLKYFDPIKRLPQIYKVAHRGLKRFLFSRICPK
jgi:hypothetical protein